MSLLNILQERRIQAVREIFRVLKPSGSALLYAWAKDQEINCQPSTYLSSKTETDQQMPATVRDNFSKTKCKKKIREINISRVFFLNENEGYSRRKKFPEIEYFSQNS